MTRFSTSNGVADFLTMSWCLQIRSTCVSTGKGGDPKSHTHNHISCFPSHPAKLSNSSRVRGTWPSKLSSKLLGTFFEKLSLIAIEA